MTTIITDASTLIANNALARTKMDGAVDHEDNLSAL